MSELQAALATGQRSLSFDARLGYLPSVLKSLDVPVESQTLVFSKSSLHREIVGPANPRAIYFNDRTYVAYLPGSPQLEFAAIVPGGEPRFYTLEQDPERITFETDDVCLLCHNPTRHAATPGVNRLLMRSHYVDRDGFTLQHKDHQDALQFAADDRVPFARRWGGWYVTGTHGAQRHLGNLQVPESLRAIGDVLRAARQLNTDTGANITSLAGRFDATAYPSGHSDIVALMVLGHQVTVDNLITQTARAGMNVESGTADERQRLASATRPLAEALLFAGEAPLTERVTGTSRYRQAFEAIGPHDGEGRSLRQLDLERRFLRWPVSFMIYSPAFDALPLPVRREVYRSVDRALSGTSALRGLPSLTDTDRTTLRTILSATKPEFSRTVNQSESRPQ